MEIQQSSLYADYIAALGWTVERLNQSYIYIKRFPFIGGLAKIQRVTKLPSLLKLIPFLKNHHVNQVAIEPDSSISEKQFRDWCKKLSKIFKLLHSPFLPTKTLHIDLTSSEDDIFRRFSEAKRRAVRRAQKNAISVLESNDINAFIKLKNRSAGFLGFMTTYGVKQLWQVFPDKRKVILFSTTPKSNTPIAGILLLFWDRTAYYWLAGATRKGKKLFAPTLLVWEALKLSKKKRCTQFDFVGVWDERMPKQNRNWRGFTKFKEGFGGNALFYPIYR